jgi:hypothetical protein
MLSTLLAIAGTSEQDVNKRKKKIGKNFVISAPYFFLGILAPDLLASDNAIAMPCFGFVTNGPFLEPL